MNYLIDLEQKIFMKHDFKITILIILLFLLAHVVGLWLLMNNFVVEVTESGEYIPVHEETVMGPRPEMSGHETIFLILASLGFGTAAILIIIKLRRFIFWKALFFIASFMSMYIALGVLLMPVTSLLLAFIIAVWKIKKPNIFVHNLSEILMYSGLAVMLVPMLTVEWAAILLLLISAYDAFAVYRSRHMVKIAKALTETGMFAGFFVPYKSSVDITGKNLDYTCKKGRTTSAILGGGDVVFPLLFTGTVLERMITIGFDKLTAFTYALIIPVGLSFLLLSFFVLAKKGKYYPAMPFLTAGCLIFYLVLMFLIGV